MNDDDYQIWRNSIGDIPGVDQITFEAERGPGDDLTSRPEDLAMASRVPAGSSEAAVREAVWAGVSYDVTRRISGGVEAPVWQRFARPTGRHPK